MSETVKVRNTSRVDQLSGIWLIRAGETTVLPINALGGFGSSVEVIDDPTTSNMTLYRTPCMPGCGHSLCTLSRQVTLALQRMGFSVDRQTWRANRDQPPIGKSLLCNAGTFEGPSGSWSWFHFDNSIAPRNHVAYFLEHFTGNICVSGAVRDALSAAGVSEDRLRVIPNGIDTSLFCPDGPIMDIGGNSFIFAMVGAMSPRKGVDVALEAYGQAFKRSDKVLLVVKNYDYGRDAWCREIIAEWRKRLGSKAPRVEYIYQMGMGNSQPPWMDSEVAAFYRRAAQHGAYLAPARVEGFGLTGLEALACGCRLGTTGWSGQLEYATDENAHLFPYMMAPSNNNLGLYEADERPLWAEPDLADVADWMRRVFEESPDELKQREIAEDLRQRFTYARMARGIADVLGLKERRGPETVRESVPGTPLAKSSGAAVLGAPSPPGMETLGVGIPTRDRPGYLAILLSALYVQTKRPNAICIVNDGEPTLRDNSAVKQMVERWEQSGIPCDIVQGSGRGASPNHQIALEHLGTDLVLRIDDDLLPARPDFIERLYRLIDNQPEVGAVGGCYPMHSDGVLHEYGPLATKRGMTNTLADLLAGHARLQFWQFSDEAVVECEHLYSTWMYRASALQEVGGFADCYSRFGQREESDASVRLFLLGKKRLLVDIQAIGWHFLAAGGRRPEGSRERAIADDKVFRSRVAQWRPKA